MTGRLVFNHHSLPFETAVLAEKALPSFLKMVLSARNKGLETIIMEKNWFDLELVKDYSFSTWRTQNKSKVKDTTDALLGIQIQLPLFHYEEIGGDLELLEVALDASPLQALRAAVWYEAPLLSFPTRSPWTSTPVKVWKQTLVSETLQKEIVELVNVHDEPSADAVFKEEEAKNKRGARDLGRLWKELFPDLELCGKAESQLRTWIYGLDLLEHIESALEKLQILGEQWKNGELQNYSHESLMNLGVRASGESESCGENPKTRGARTFYTAYGEEQYFENHIKLAKSFRIHFYPDTIAKAFHVGYIGPHLILP